MASINSLMYGGDPYNDPYDDLYDDLRDENDIEELTDHYFSDAHPDWYGDDPDHEDRRKDWLENYAAEAVCQSSEKDELPF